jgi:hypothetical protein
MYSFDTREICEEVVRTFNNTAISKTSGEEHIIQIRYSDTPEQKVLKQQTAAARQFRAAEFDYGCSEAMRLGLLQPNNLTPVAGNAGEPYMSHSNTYVT